MGLMEYAHDTWFARPNHEQVPVMSVGVGKFLMASKSFGDGVIPVRVIVSPVNVTVSRQNSNFSEFKTIPFLYRVLNSPQCGKKLIRWYNQTMLYHQHISLYVVQYL